MKNFFQFFRTILAICLVVGLIAPTPLLADADFDHAEKGLSLNSVKGRTLVGVTRDSSKVWSLYLARNGKAFFNFSSGKKSEATWEQKSRNIICFKGLVADNPSKEICKLATPLGRGMDWMSVTLHQQNGKTVYDKVTKDEQRGTSQLVYAFLGDTKVEQDTYISDLSKWAGYLIVGRTLKDKEAWFAQLGIDGSVEFVFGSGKRANGRYKLTTDTICFTFPSQSNLNGCRKPLLKDGKVMWASAENGGYISEVVFMKKTESDGPQKIKQLSPDSHHMVLVNWKTGTIAAVNRKGAGSIDLYDAKAQMKIGSIAGYARDMSFSPDGVKLAANYKNRVWLIDLDTGLVDWSYAAPEANLEFTEVAVSTDGQSVFVAQSDGHVAHFSANDGRFVARYKWTDKSISDIKTSHNGTILATDDAGRMIVSGQDDLSRFKAHKVSDKPLTLVEFVGRSDNFLVLNAYGELRGGSVETLSQEMSIDRTFASRKDGKEAHTYGFAISPSATEVFLPNSVSRYFLNYPSLTEVSKTSRLPNFGSVQYMPFGKGLVGKTYTSGKSGPLEIWARDMKEASLMSQPTPSDRRVARTREKIISDAQESERNKYKALITKANDLVNRGLCDQYTDLRDQLKTSDQISNAACLRVGEQKKIAETYKLALKELRCDDAVAIGATLDSRSSLEERTCRQNATKKANKDRFTTAMAQNDCETIAELQSEMKEPDAAANCALKVGMEAETARKMYFAAVKFDTSKDRVRAKLLYTEVMNRFSDDDLAIDSANRLTQLNDLEIMEQTQAENEAALKAAQAALAQANADKAKAEREAAKAAEQARREAEQARREADARAREAERRAAEARAQANRQLSRNTACDHVYVGKEFEARGGVLRLKNRYVVVGVSGRSSLATIRSKYSDYRQEVSCYDIP